MARLKEEQGIVSMNEPSINQDVDFNEIDTEKPISRSQETDKKEQKSSKKVAKEEK